MYCLFYVNDLYHVTIFLASINYPLLRFFFFMYLVLNIWYDSKQFHCSRISEPWMS